MPKARAVRTVYLKLRQSGRVVHTATIRSDWRLSDYHDLARRFPNTYVKTARLRIPVMFLGDSYHHTAFKNIECWRWE